jgi:hypothetical protein
MNDSLDWYWRLRMGLPPRPEDREILGRIAPELFGLDGNLMRESDECQRRLPSAEAFRGAVRRWLRTEDDRPLVTVREGSCPQHDC